MSSSKPQTKKKQFDFQVNHCCVSFFQGGMAGLVPTDATEGKRVRQLQVGQPSSNEKEGKG